MTRTYITISSRLIFILPLDALPEVPKRLSVRLEPTASLNFGKTKVIILDVVDRCALPYITEARSLGVTFF